MSEADLHENPLVPNTKLRELYLAMVEARVLDEHRAGRKADGKKQPRLHSMRGEEACRASTAIDLQSGDLVSDAQPGVTLDLPAGVRVDSLLPPPSKRSAGGRRVQQAEVRQLPWIRNSGERLRLAMGAALSLKTLKQGNLVVAYARQGELGSGEWRKILKIASRLELPIFFVLLPAAPAKKKPEKKSLRTRMRSCGVPGIAVDADDAIALYRVAQETYGRIRGGGGPVFMECVAFSLEGPRRISQSDSIVQLKQYLLERKVATLSWLDGAGSDLRLRLEKASL